MLYLTEIAREATIQQRRQEDRRKGWGMAINGRTFGLGLAERVGTERVDCVHTAPDLPWSSFSLSQVTGQIVTWSQPT